MHLADNGVFGDAQAAADFQGWNTFGPQGHKGFNAIGCPVDGHTIIQGRER